MYILAYVKAFSDEACINIVVGNEDKIIKTLCKLIGLKARDYRNLKELSEFLYDDADYECEGGEMYTVADDKGKVIIELG